MYHKKLQLFKFVNEISMQTGGHYEHRVNLDALVK